VALVALLMLLFASVQSTIMQTQVALAAGTTPICGSADPSAGHGIATAHTALKLAATSSTPDQPPTVPHHHGAVCPICAAAGVLPILGQAVPIPDSTVLAFTAYPGFANHRPRGPPAQRSRARGPPSGSLTA
jgi:hypothetical protein